MPAIVRAAVLPDAPEIARLLTQLGYEADPVAIAHRLSRLLSRDDQQFLVAEQDHAVIGWVHALRAEYLEAEPFVVIGGLVVDRQHRGRGVGRLLVRQAEAWAASNGCPVVRLWSSTTRTASHEFYERIGYTRIKTQHAFAKPLDGAADRDLARFVPRVDESADPGP